MRASLAFALAVLVAALATVLGLASVADSSIDMEVRTRPHHTQAGRLQRPIVMGQGFRCEFDGLHRVDVGLVPMGDASSAQLELVLRKQSPAGEVLRRVAASELPPSPGWGRFDFDPLLDSAEEEYWWQLEIPGAARQSPYSPWIRYHGQPGIKMGWGKQVLPGTVFEGTLGDEAASGPRPGTFARVPQPFLAAVSFAVENLRPVVGDARLELWGQGQTAFKDPPLRSVDLSDMDEVHGGYAFFAFEPIKESQWVDLSYRLTVHPGSRIVGDDRGPSRITWHGKGMERERLLGCSAGETTWLDRSLVFRAHSAPGVMDLVARVRQRAGWPLWLGAFCWLLAAGLLGRTICSK
ncbi:MAG: hypothetical protein ACI9F9_000934 [Candidatus Paceibacteria bacterium]|jgi:hypothetical protein